MDLRRKKWRKRASSRDKFEVRFAKLLGSFTAKNYPEFEIIYSNFKSRNSDIRTIEEKSPKEVREKLFAIYQRKNPNTQKCILCDDYVRNDQMEMHFKFHHGCSNKECEKLFSRIEGMKRMQHQGFHEGAKVPSSNITYATRKRKI